MIKLLSNLLADIEESKKKWKHSDKFESEVKQIINKLHLIAKKKTDFSSLKNNQLPPRLANNWLKNQAIEYFELDPDDDFRINLGSKRARWTTSRSGTEKSWIRREGTPFNLRNGSICLDTYPLCPLKTVMASLCFSP